ncbi:hypothetical protein NDU88_005201 [Pleurodeles waltl]|uniref:Uncharacterized protein n=1 Tax=Pleurodeles waltl TaxID=8319 RepID=A0AAV7PF94_PLEWA|nr:hypothetical protein NDU88_005201 [Pleurodeles waltl]
MHPGGPRTCPPGTILVILASIKARFLFHLRAGEAETRIKTARHIGAVADERPGESSGSYKVDMAPEKCTDYRRKGGES